jgi:hypothetical protein
LFFVFLVAFCKKCGFFLLGFTTSESATRDSSGHQHLHRQSKPQLPELNNNNIIKVSENSQPQSSLYVRRCLSVSTAAAAAATVPTALPAATLSISSSIVDTPDSSSAQQKKMLSPNLPSHQPRLYTKSHHHTSTSRQKSLSPRVIYNHFLNDDLSNTHLSSSSSEKGFLGSSEKNNNFENYDFDALAKSPSATYSYLKSFFKRVKTPEPYEHHHHHHQHASSPTAPTTPTIVSVPTFDALACDRLITDTVSMPSTPHSTFFSNPFQPKLFHSNSPTTSSIPENSRRSDVSQTSLHSNSTSSNYTTKTTGGPQSNNARTKSSSTINSDQGSAATHKISSAIQHGSSSSDKTPKRCLDQRVFVVWLERLEDMYHFPYEQLFEITEDGSRYTSSKPDHVIVFLYLAEPGLVRIHIEGIWTKYGQPGPLADGIVVSLGSLPQLLRETICSIARRKCLEVDTFQASSTRRQKAIQEFSKKYLSSQNYEDFLESFISSS